MPPPFDVPPPLEVSPGATRPIHPLGTPLNPGENEAWFKVAIAVTMPKLKYELYVRP